MIKVDIRKAMSFAWRHKVALTAVGVLAVLNHENAKDSKSKGEFITSKGLNQEYWCYRETK